MRNCFIIFYSFILYIIPTGIAFTNTFTSSNISAFSNVTLHYTPISIPARDTSILAADLYYSDSTPQAKPVILIQTPYNKNYYRLGTIPSQAGGNFFPMDEHYNYVISDWRGFFGSASATVPGYDRGLDGYDSVEWIASQSWSNGSVGTWGSSALGLIQYQTAKYHPPHLVCCVPQVKDYITQYENFYYGGDYRKEHVESLAALGLTDTTLILSHQDLDLTWAVASALTDNATTYNVPILVIGGWYDHFPNDVLRSFEDLRLKSDSSVRQKHKLIFGPWTHSGVGESEQGQLIYPDATGLDTTIIQFWDYYLRAIPNGWDQKSTVSYYQMGENKWYYDNSWTGISSRSTTIFYLQPSNSLSTVLPSLSNSSNTFSYDPNDPTPALGGSRFDPFDTTVIAGPVDLSTTIENRSDVLVYSTDTLSQDLRVNGYVSAQLYVSSNQPDTDFCIRLTDVYPDGRSMIITQGIRRMRFRNSYSTETLMTPGQIYPVTIELQNLAYTFLQGHQLRVDISSADYPYVDKNLNDGGPMYVNGTGNVAQNNIFHETNHPSNLTVQTIPAIPTGVELWSFYSE